MTLLPLIVAVFTWNQLAGMTVFVCLPSHGIVEQVCVGETACMTPDNPVVAVVDWDGPVPYVKARVRHPDGSVGWIYADPLPDIKS